MKRLHRQCIPGPLFPLRGPEDEASLNVDEDKDVHVDADVNE